MKKLIILAVVCLTTLAAQADDTYAYLTFTNNNKVEQSFPAVGLTITFADGQALVSQDGQQVSLPLADLQRMFFSAVPAGVTELKADDNSPLTVVSVSGQLVGTFKNKTEMQASLKKGIYVVKTDGKTYKMAVK